MSKAFQRPPRSDEYSSYAPQRVRETVRSGRNAPPTEDECPKRDAPPRRNVNASFHDDRSESPRFRSLNVVERPPSPMPLAQRDVGAYARHLWRPALAAASAAALALFVFAPLAVRLTSDTRGSFDEAPPARSRATGKKIQEALHPALAAPKLVVEPLATQRLGANAPLGVTVRDSRDGGLIVVSGLARGAVLSAGNQVDDNSWWLSFADLNNLEILPPPKFIGAMEIAVELRLADATLSDRKTRRIEWVDEAQEAKAGGASAVQAGDQEGLFSDSKRGQELIAQGDVQAAREVIRRVTNAAGGAGLATPPGDRANVQDASGDRGAAQERETESNSKARNDDGPKADSSVAKEYRAGCFVKIDGHVQFDGSCQIRWAKDTSVTFALAHNPITLTRDHGRTWRMIWGKRKVGNVFKRDSCWGSRRVYICERNK